MLAPLSEALINVGSRIDFCLPLSPHSFLSHTGGIVQVELLRLLNTQSQCLHSSTISTYVTFLFAEAKRMALVDMETTWRVPESIIYFFTCYHLSKF